MMRQSILWLALLVACGDDIDEGCWEVSPQRCDALSQCSVMRARRLDEPRSCLLAPEPVGCMPQLDCSAEEIFARNEAGEIFQFPSGCLPPSWREVQPEDSSPRECDGVAP